eukprot:TRINITY_DN80290_c0_g1_i1.p1 TRINITY_DN80290_c0_g1~~TRINITY_DN80290_c0_g1_i1.p1  ORF type:complete len:444 (+),score=73.31 TRINITY_DN80290_c0_g1_i1:28-1359(+)
MVVCLVVRIRNASRKTFRLIQAGDPFYSPTIGGYRCPSSEEHFEIPPGFNEAAEDLVVPWEATSTNGLVIVEASSGKQLRCVVGPNTIDTTNTDWLRLHDSDWEPLEEAQWFPLGRRHLLGAIGKSVELQLTFREPKSSGSTNDSNRNPAAQLADCINFETELAGAPPQTVFLNVYDLAPMTSTLNSVLCNTVVKTLGAFHAAIEVHGEEWGFYRQPDPDACGVFRSRQPRQHPVHVYRQSVNLGTTTLKDFEVWRLIRTDVLDRWPSGRYDLLRSNCIHFCEELAELLGVNPVPSWVRGLHETGAAAASLLRWSVRPLTLLGIGAAEPLALQPVDQEGAEECTDDIANQTSARNGEDLRIRHGGLVVECSPGASQARRPSQDASQQEAWSMESSPLPSLRRPAFLPDPESPRTNSFESFASLSDCGSPKQLPEEAVKSEQHS